MTPEAAHLRRLAQPLVASYPAETLAAALLIGSAAAGDSDRASDLDIALFFHEPLADSAVAALKAGAEATGGTMLGGDGHGFVVQRYERGVKVDIAHTTLARWRELTAAVLTQHDPASPYQKVLFGLHDGLPLLGLDLLEALRAESAYPEPLRAAMVRAHLDFWPTELVERMVADRGDSVWLGEIFAKAATNVLSILCGVNRVYHWGEFKRQAALCARFAAKPDNLAERLDAAMRTRDPRLLHALIDDTLDVVDMHLPEVDTAPVRARLRRPLPRWEPDPA